MKNLYVYCIYDKKRSEYIQPYRARTHIFRSKSTASCALSSHIHKEDCEVHKMLLMRA